MSAYRLCPATCSPYPLVTHHLVPARTSASTHCSHHVACMCMVCVSCVSPGSGGSSSAGQQTWTTFQQSGPNYLELWLNQGVRVRRDTFRFCGGPGAVQDRRSVGVVRDSNSGHHILSSPAEWCLIFASRTTQALIDQWKTPTLVIQGGKVRGCY